MLRLSQNPILRPPPDQEQRELANRTTLLRTSAKRQMEVKLHSANAVAEIAALPGLEESLHIICRGNFPLFAVIPAILDLSKPSKIRHLAGATLGFSKSNAISLFELLDAGQIGTVDIVASCYFQRQSPAEWNLMADGLAARGQRIVALRAHAKIIAVEMTDGRAFAVESSANWRSCRNLEQIVLTQSPPLYRFHRDWVAHVIDAARKGVK